MAKKHILIVDDELMILYSMRRMLDDVYEVSIAKGGKAAIDSINKDAGKIDLIICDISMPDINGVNLYLYIAQHHPELQKKIIFMTGGPMSPYLDDFFVTNKCICLSKPFDYDSLREKIKEVLAASEVT